jgi:hypothetical protein
VPGATTPRVPQYGWQWQSLLRCHGLDLANPDTVTLARVAVWSTSQGHPATIQAILAMWVAPLASLAPRALASITQAR